jgi:LytS/YehU family sensor histidine kinase
VDIIYTFLFHWAIIFVVYTNIQLLIPKFLEKKKYWTYILSLIGLILSGIAINAITFGWLADLIFPNYYFIDYYDFSDILEFIVSYLLITSLFKFSKGWFRQLEAKQKIGILEKEKTVAELNALKTQINPHFLFNSLNNLYSLSLDNDKRTPRIILRLSEMMRYLLYETEVQKVSLQKEIEHLDNYIEMQELRVGADADIKFIKEGHFGEAKIAPLLFLPLVENAFTHGVKGNKDGAFIHILLSFNQDEVFFKVGNKKGEVDKILHQKNGGVGLENLQKRLELIYPDKHQLKIIDSTDEYSTMLKINLS